MTEVIPAIIAHDFKDLREKILKIADYVDWVQLDVMDGQFVPNVTWYNVEELKNLDSEIISKIKLEAHLMIWEPEKTIDKWINSGIKRIIFHYEATHQREELIKKIKDGGLEVGMCLDIFSPYTFLEKFVNNLDLVLIMAVKAGKGGQEFQKEALIKIKNLHKNHLDLKIAVDGGINLETGKECVQAGASILCAGSYIFESINIEQAINSLKNL